MKKKIIIPVVVIIILLVIGLVYMNQSQESSLTPTPTETPVPTETPTPTPEPTPTVTPVSDEGLQYEFDLYVETYKYDNGVTDEDLRNNQDTRYLMYEDIYSSGYDHVDAAKEQEEGCTHEFIEEFRQYSLDRNLEKIPDPNATEPPADTSGKYEVSPGVYNDGTTRELTPEEMDNMTIEEKRAYSDANAKQAGFQSYDDVDKISEEKTQEAFDILTDPNNPYVQEILEYKASLNN